MPQLLLLPVEIVGIALSQFLETVEVAKLDTAVCQHNCRDDLLNSLKLFLNPWNRYKYADSGKQ